MNVSTSRVPTVVRRATFVLFACAIASCGSSDSAGPSCVVSAVAVLPPSASVAIGATTPLQANVAQTGCGTVAVQWQTGNAAVATVSQTGVVTGVAAGTVAITATAGGQVGSSVVTVTIPPVANVAIAGGRSNMLSGSTIQLSATTSDASGNALTGRAITWSTSDASTATVSATGLVTGLVIGGPVTITATSEGKTATQVVNVNGRLGYAVVSNPAAATIAVDAATSFNASGLPITVTKIATGQFHVVFAGLNRLNTTTQKDISIVNATGFGNAACASAGWGPVGTTDLFADLQCTAAGGALADVPFSIMILGSDAFGGRTSFTLADTPAATSPYNGPFTWTFNGAGAASPAVITHLSTGMYTVAFTNDGRVAGSNPETFLVSSRDPAATCQVQIWTLSTATVTVKCVDVVGGTTLRDAQFHVALIDRGRPNMRAAFAWSDCGSVSCTPNATYRYSSASSTPTVDHTSLGVYVVHFPGLTRPAGGSDIVFVSAYGAGVLCKAVSWANAPSGTELTANVQCFGGGFSLADALFDILVVQ